MKIPPYKNSTHNSHQLVLTTITTLSYLFLLTPPSFFLLGYLKLNSRHNINSSLITSEYFSLMVIFLLNYSAVVTLNKIKNHSLILSITYLYSNKGQQFATPNIHFFGDIDYFRWLFLRKSRWRRSSQNQVKVKENLHL